MENSNPLVRLVTYAKVKKMIRQFIGKPIDPLESNMMRGMFTRKLKDFSELQSEQQKSVSMLERVKSVQLDDWEDK